MKNRRKIQISNKGQGYTPGYMDTRIYGQKSFFCRSVRQNMGFSDFLNFSEIFRKYFAKKQFLQCRIFLPKFCLLHSGVSDLQFVRLWKILDILVKMAQNSPKSKVKYTYLRNGGQKNKIPLLCGQKQFRIWDNLLEVIRLSICDTAYSNFQGISHCFFLHISYLFCAMRIVIRCKQRDIYVLFVLIFHKIKRLRIIFRCFLW